MLVLLGSGVRSHLGEGPKAAKNEKPGQGQGDLYDSAACDTAQSA